MEWIKCIDKKPVDGQLVLVCSTKENKKNATKNAERIHEEGITNPILIEQLFYPVLMAEYLDGCYYLVASSSDGVLVQLNPTHWAKPLKSPDNEN